MGERGELGCRRRRQSSSPSELRYIIPEWLVVRVGFRVTVRVRVMVGVMIGVSVRVGVGVRPFLEQRLTR